MSIAKMNFCDTERASGYLYFMMHPTNVEPVWLQMPAMTDCHALIQIARSYFSDSSIWTLN